ncbi:unnamed protein product [Prorocentrum cordatum]|uniref:Uncharacterized protein n=1 Tax=Prorocentrum cordatum TaxID=2364126 RepID=A0ABN9TWJ7_9DINO|nr:unnamed protein product [Polarella glacialis]
MAASAQKVRLIAGGWTAALGAAGFVTHRRLSSFEERGPCVRQAVELLAASGAARQTLGGGGLRLAWWPRECQVHGAAGRSCASFVVQGDAGHVRVLLAARRRPPATQAEWEAAEDDLDLKALAFGALGGLRQGRAAEAAVEALPWDIEALCVRRDGEAKSEASRARRLAKSVRVSSSYGHVAARLGPRASVQSSSGTFEAGYINPRCASSATRVASQTWRSRPRAREAARATGGWCWQG